MKKTNPTSYCGKLNSGGFTLVELLVVIGIMGVLTALLLPSLGQAKRAAHGAVFLSNLRQLSVGYTTYRFDHDGLLLYGYAPKAVDGKTITVTTNGGHEFGYPIADRYPWRLAPYVGDVWGVLHSHQPIPELPSASDTTSEALFKAYELSIYPTFGINSIYVGGHNSAIYQGFIATGSSPHGNAKPNRGAHVVFREDEVKRTSNLITFTEVQIQGFATAEPGDGNHFASPPFANGQRWKPDANGNGFELTTTGHITGMPQGRNGYTPTAFFDGHAQAMNATALFDMRLWSNWATHEKDDFIDS